MFATLLLAAEEVNVKAKNPILPEGKELLWGSISFIIVFALLAWKAWPAIKAGLQARQDRIRDDLQKAETEAKRLDAEVADLSREREQHALDALSHKSGRNTDHASVVTRSPNSRSSRVNRSSVGDTAQASGSATIVSERCAILSRTNAWQLPRAAFARMVFSSSM